MTLRHLYIVILIFCFGIAGAQTSFSVMADTNQVLIGGQVKLEIKAQLAADDEIKWPLLFDSLAGFEIVNKSSVKEEVSEGRKTLTQELWITSFDSGYAFIPALTAQVGEQMLESQAIGILVGMPEVEQTEDYYDIKEPLDPPPNWILIIGVILLLLAIGALIYWLIKRFQKRGSTEVLAPEASMTPYEWAVLQLGEIKQEKLWQQGQVKEYYSKVTLVLRQYIEREMDKPAMESTADEVTEIIRELNPGDELLEKCTRLMALSVGVKYAKLTPSESDHNVALNTLEDFLEAYKPKEEKAEDVSVSV